MTKLEIIAQAFRQWYDTSDSPGVIERERSAAIDLEADLMRAGFVIVPKKPTPEMIEAARHVDEWCVTEGQAPQPEVYEEMIEAYIKGKVS